MSMPLFFNSLALAAMAKVAEAGRLLIRVESTSIVLCWVDAHILQMFEM